MEVECLLDNDALKHKVASEAKSIFRVSSRGSRTIVLAPIPFIVSPQTSRPLHKLQPFRASSSRGH